jgi:hypothetical protein
MTRTKRPIHAKKPTAVAMIVTTASIIQMTLADIPNAGQPRTSNQSDSSQRQRTSSQQMTVRSKNTGSARNVRSTRPTLDSEGFASLMASAEANVVLTGAALRAASG